MSPRDYFPRVREAREALAGKALAILQKYEMIIDLAIAKGDFETAETAARWLLEHMPNEDGQRLIDPSAAKVQEADGPRGPTIQIGVMLGPPPSSSSGSLPPIPTVQALPPDSIEAEVIKNESDPTPILSEESTKG